MQPSRRFEFLPALLGTNAVASYCGYDTTTNPNIANEFSAAAFRLGHSLINDDVEFFGNDGRAVRDEVALSEAFNNPTLLRDAGADQDGNGAPGAAKSGWRA